MYCLHSKIDNVNFEVNQKVVDASVLLKNVCSFTEITEPISINCSEQCLDIYIKLINHYDIISDYHDVEFELNLFKYIKGQRLIDLVKEMCILDSDFFIDTIADIILHRCEERDWQSIKLFFGFTDDYSFEEREFIQKHTKEFFFSIDSELLKFPFQNAPSFNILRNKFYTPMNVLLSRILYRGNGKISYQFLIINKSLKNEFDRMPFKVTRFYVSGTWKLVIGLPNVPALELSTVNDKKLMNDIKTRKMIVTNEIDLSYQSNMNGILECSSLNFILPGKGYPLLQVYFEVNEKHIKYFDIKECPFPSIKYSLASIKITFEHFYEQLIAKDLSKTIEVYSENVLLRGNMTIYKKSNASKFHELFTTNNNIKICQKFKNFVFSFMESDGVIISNRRIFEISHTFDNQRKYVYKISDIKEYMLQLG